MQRDASQRGFTLIELMVALAVSSILIMMVLSVFSRMTTAYRRQQQVASLQMVLSAAQNLIAQEARQAGFQMANGFMIASDVLNLQRPVRILNDNAGPDEVRFYSADASVQARVINVPAPPTNTDIYVDDNQFVNGELAVIVNTATINVTHGATTKTIAAFTACVVRVTFNAGLPTRLLLDTVAPWGSATNPHCDAVLAAHVAVATANQTMIYRFRARAYRLDPARLALGVLQVSPSGALVANDWQDLGIGFADLQVAARMFIDADLDGDADGDGDAEYDWYSGAAMQANTAPAPIPAPLNFITRLTVSVSARTDRSVDGIASAATPAFIDLGLPNNNNLGDRPSVNLVNGDRVYRYSTNRVDMRNTGAGL
jgi:prepilin-type N-terminal cleavage/methylation domain-containing protein